jgi:hypothetical protein
MSGDALSLLETAYPNAKSCQDLGTCIAKSCGLQLIDSKRRIDKDYHSILPSLLRQTDRQYSMQTIRAPS